MPNFPSCPPPPLLSQPIHTLCTHSSTRVRRHYCPTQQRPRCSTRFLLLISRCFRHFLTTSPIVLPARSGLTRSTVIILLSDKPLLDPKDISAFLLLCTQHCSTRRTALFWRTLPFCSRPKDSRLCHHCRGAAEQQQIQLFHKDPYLCLSPLTISSGVDTFKPIGIGEQPLWRG